MLIKKGVKIAGVRPETVLAMNIADAVVREKTGTEMVVTSITDGVHGKGSLHYVGQAFDIRTRDFSKTTIAALVLLLREHLGENYDVVIESTHVHIEFQPK